jgi:hypothetical protein
MVVLTLWALATGPTVVTGNGLADLYTRYLDTRSSLLGTALLLFAGSMIAGAVAWHLVVERPRFRGATGRIWFAADRLFVFVTLGMSLLLPNLNPFVGVTITTAPDEATMTFIANPAGAAQVVVVLSAVLAYLHAGSLALAADWAQGRAEATGTAPA